MKLRNNLLCLFWSAKVIFRVVSMILEAGVKKMVADGTAIYRTMAKNRIANKVKLITVFFFKVLNKKNKRGQVSS